MFKALSSIPSTTLNGQTKCEAMTTLPGKLTLPQNSRKKVILKGPIYIPQMSVWELCQEQGTQGTLTGSKKEDDGHKRSSRSAGLSTFVYIQPGGTAEKLSYLSIKAGLTQTEKD